MDSQPDKKSSLQEVSDLNSLNSVALSKDNQSQSQTSYNGDFEDNEVKQLNNEQNSEEELTEDEKLKLKLEKLKSISENDYTIMTKGERVFMALLLATVGLCSAMTMPIYWAALTDMKIAFHTTEAKINYTVTSYLCFQAVAPVFISSLSDILGRRPVILCCIIGGIATNIGLACSRKYWLIVFLRCVLATCLAPLISLTTASVGDFTTRRNRGGLAGLTSGFTLIGQGIAPFLGAVMETAWGWPAIFWFSAALEGVILIMVYILLPETHRGFVGDMSITPKSKFHQSPVLWYFRDRIKPYDETKLDSYEKRYSPWTPLKLVVEPAVFYILLPASLLFSIWTISQTSLSVHLAGDYHYSTLIIGICFFSPGIATMIGTIVSGRLLDRLYKRRKSEYDFQYNQGANLTMNPLDIPPFNIIHVRLFYIPFAGLVVIAASIVFGWCIEYKVNVAVILVMCFLLTFCCMIPLNVATTVLVDMFPHIAGGATALNNLFRCGMSAIFVSCLNKMENSMSTGGTYTFMGGIAFLSLGLILLLMKKSGDILMENKRKLLAS